MVGIAILDVTILCSGMNIKHTASILTRLKFKITTAKIWYLVSTHLWYAVWYTTSNVVVETAPPQNSNNPKSRASEILIIVAQYNRGYWLPVTVVVIFQSLVERLF